MFTWEEYQNQAIKLAKTNNKANYRSAISRSYYSSYCKCRNYILQNNITDNKTKNKIKHKKGNVHKIVQEVFKNGKNLNEKQLSKEISIILDESRKHRNKTDYEDKYNGNLEKDTKIVLSNTTFIIKKPRIY